METGKRKTSKQSMNSGGLGIAGMETRAQACGGRLNVESSLEKGTAIEVTCPAE